MENEEEKRSTPSQSMPSDREDSIVTPRWIAGVFYFSRNNPSLLVAKRSGLGTTINFGHPLSWWLVGGLLVVLGGIQLAFFLSTHNFINLLVLVFLLVLLLLIGYLRSRPSRKS